MIYRDFLFLIFHYPFLSGFIIGSYSLMNSNKREMTGLNP